METRSYDPLQTDHWFKSQANGNTGLLSVRLPQHGDKNQPTNIKLIH